jgi:hypothetical protein
MLTEGKEACMVDIPLTCWDCSSDFHFTVGEQKYRKDRGWDNQPVRCIACQEAKLMNDSAGSGSGAGASSRGNINGAPARSDVCYAFQFQKGE